MHIELERVRMEKARRERDAKNRVYGGFKGEQRERDAVDRLLRTLSSSFAGISDLCEYVKLEYPRIQEDRRLNMESLRCGGVSVIVGIYIHLESLRSGIRWGDLMKRLYGDVVFPREQ